MKCPHCQSCVGRNKIIAENQLLIYCLLCLKVWKLNKSKLEEVPEDLKIKALKLLDLKIIN